MTLEWRAGAGSFTSRARETNVLVRVNGRWRFAQHSDTPVMALGDYPVAAAPDSATLGEFVGDYEGWLGAFDRVTQRGSELYLQDPDHKESGAVKLVAAGAEAFYPENESVALMVFVRDTTGRVSHYITRMAGGPLLIARKVR